MSTSPPLFLIDLFPKLDHSLIEVLESLSPADWEKPTVCKLWNVKDIAAHLLDGNIRKLSIGRDTYFGEQPENINSYPDLVAYLNQLNADWVKAAKRMSPSLLIQFLQETNQEVYTFLKSIDPFAPAIFSVAWAGEEQSANWFDIAREYTERWHHQQQIRLAVNKPGILTQELYFPVLDTFMRALPHCYRHTKAAEGTIVQVSVTGETNGQWVLTYTAQQWHWLAKTTGSATTLITIPATIAWLLFTKGMNAAEASQYITIQGAPNLANPILSMITVMA